MLNWNVYKQFKNLPLCSKTLSQFWCVFIYFNIISLKKIIINLFYINWNCWFFLNICYKNYSIWLRRKKILKMNLRNPQWLLTSKIQPGMVWSNYAVNNYLNILYLNDHGYSSQDRHCSCIIIWQQNKLLFLISVNNCSPHFLLASERKYWFA